MRVHRIHDRSAPLSDSGDRRPAGLDRYVKVAETYAIERNFTWRQSSLTVIQIQLGGVSVGTVAIGLGWILPGLLTMLSGTAWAVTHEFVKSADRRRTRRALTEDPVALAIVALGGYGALPAQVTHLPVQGEEAGGLRWLAGLWEREHPFTPGQRETFEALVPEYLGTIDELYSTCVELEAHNETGYRPDGAGT